VKLNCTYCNKEFSADWSGRKFCTRSCSAKRNNSLYPKRIMDTISCTDCGSPVSRASRRKRCANCKHAGYLYTLTLGEYRNKFSSAAKCYNAARSISRSQYAVENRPKSCAICSYNKHIDVCHIADLHKLPDDTSLYKALSNGNLIALCRNCHWEFDHELL
jgi:hypothetical protein